MHPCTFVSYILYKNIRITDLAIQIWKQTIQFQVISDNM